MKVLEKKQVDETFGETEGARRATGVFPNVAPAAGPPPPTMGAETEVVAKAQRRRFTAEYKRRIVREADRCTTPGGDRGAAPTRGAVLLVPDDVAGGARSRGTRGAGAQAARAESGAPGPARQEDRGAGA
jgi:hypothetical protein